MSDPYERVNGGRLAFKGGDLATRKSIEKKNKKKQKKKNKEKLDDGAADIEKNNSSANSSTPADDIYSINAAKKKKYDDLFPVEAKKFGYIPKSNFESVAEALDDRVTKKADRYCK